MKIGRVQIDTPYFFYITVGSFFYHFFCLIFF